MNFIDKRNQHEDHFQSYITTDPVTGKKKGKMLTPSMVVHIKDKEELKLQLEHYKKPFIGDLVPNSKIARRNLVEHVRPALRYWCKKFGQEIPEWLQNEDEWTKMEDQQKLDFFGVTKLTVKEFKKFKQVPMPIDKDGKDTTDGSQGA